MGVPVAAGRVEEVTETSDRLAVLIRGEPGEMVELFFADARGTQAGAEVPDSVYVAHEGKYCDDGRASGEHVYAYTSDTDSLEQCRLRCGKVGCSCFDYRSAGLRGDTGEHLWKCRVSIGIESLTASGAGYAAYTPMPYAKHEGAYCNDGRPDEQHEHAYTSDDDSFEECMSHCDALQCSCFDFRTVAERSKARLAGEHLWACRVSTVPCSTTQSSADTQHTRLLLRRHHLLRVCRFRVYSAPLARMAQRQRSCPLQLAILASARAILFETRVLMAVVAEETFVKVAELLLHKFGADMHGFNDNMVVTCHF